MHWKPKKTKSDGPERKIQDAIKAKLTLLDWYVMETHGNLYQSGFPDLYICHRKYGARWIECKNPEAYSFTDSQIRCFTRMSGEGVGIFILVSDADSEIDKLFGPANWYQYLSVMR